MHILDMETYEKEPDIKEFIKFIHTDLENIRTECGSHQKDYQEVSSDLKRIENYAEDNIINLANALLDQTEILEKEFKKFMADEKSECSYLKLQLTTLNQDSMKIQQNSLLLGTRIQEAEKTVGIGIKLPPIKNRN
jgi:uncharacterized protein (DUF3084 family)